MRKLLLALVVAGLLAVGVASTASAFPGGAAGDGCAQAWSHAPAFADEHICSGGG
jgi:hypothetical protein